MKNRVIKCFFCLIPPLFVLIGHAVGNPFEAIKGLYTLFAFIISKHGIKAAIAIYVLIVPFIEALWRKAFFSNNTWVDICSVLAYSVAVTIIAVHTGRWWMLILLLAFALSFFAKDNKVQKLSRSIVSVISICLVHAYIILYPHWTIIFGILAIICSQIALFNIASYKGVTFSIECHSITNAIIFAIVCTLNGGLTNKGITIDQFKSDNFTIEIKQVGDADLYSSDYSEVFVGSMSGIAADVANRLIADTTDRCRRNYIYRNALRRREWRCPVIVEIHRNEVCTISEILQKLIDEQYLIADTIYEQKYMVYADSGYVMPESEPTMLTLKDVINHYVRGYGHPFEIAEETNDLIPTDFSYGDFPTNGSHEDIAKILREHHFRIEHLDYSRVRIITFRNGTRLSFL